MGICSSQTFKATKKSQQLSNYKLDSAKTKTGILRRQQSSIEVDLLVTDELHNNAILLEMEKRNAVNRVVNVSLHPENQFLIVFDTQMHLNKKVPILSSLDQNPIVIRRQHYE